LKHLGVTTPRLSSGVGETASELTALGQVAWAPEQDTPDIHSNILSTARSLTEGKNGGDARPARPVLGCFLSLSWSRAVNSYVVPKAIEALRPPLPGNTLALAEISQQLYLSQARTRPTFELPEATELLRKYPQNQALWAAQAYLYRLPKRNLTMARKAAEMQVRACHGNPEAWLLLGDTIAHQFARIRQGRPIEEQSDAEQEACLEFLMEELLVRLKTIALSPDHPVGWMQVSHCEARLGQATRAIEAFDRALKLDPNEYTLLGWGIQLFSPGWFHNQAKLLEVADQAVKVGKSWRIAYRIQMYWLLQSAGLPDRAEALVLREAERFRFEEAKPMP
jgi:tetratricopeptide (TPR) repeat protein